MENLGTEKAESWKLQIKLSEQRIRKKALNASYNKYLIKTITRIVQFEKAINFCKSGYIVIEEKG